MAVKSPMDTTACKRAHSWTKFASFHHASGFCDLSGMRKCTGGVVSVECGVGPQTQWPQNLPNI